MAGGLWLFYGKKTAVLFIEKRIYKIRKLFFKMPIVSMLALDDWT